MARRAQAKGKGKGKGGARSVKRRIRGMGISVRIAVSISITVTVLMALGGFILYNQAAGALDEAIDSFGVTVTRTLALQDIDTWRYKSGTYQELRERIRDALDRYPAWLQGRCGVVAADEMAPRLSREKYRGQRDAINAYDRQRMKLNQRRLEGVTAVFTGDERIDVDVVDVFIFDRRGKLLVKASPKRAGFDAYTRSRNYIVYDEDGVAVETATEIESGTITIGGRVLPGRSFTQPIYGEAGGRVGHVQLIMSEDRVAARKQRLAISCLVITLVMLIAGVAVSLVLANALAAPVLKLVEVVDSVARGQYDVRAYGHSRDEIGLLAQSIDTMRASLQEAEKDQTTLAAREREMSMVADLRRNLLPNEVPEVEGFELEASYRPTTRVGGNYYDFFQFPDGRLGVLVADTAGEGFIAGFTMNLFRGLVHAEKEWVEDPVELLRRVNRHISKDIKKGVFVTAFLVVVTPESGELQLVNAGHLPVLKWTGKERKLRVASAEGIALGLDKGPIFDERLNASKITLGKGDRIVLYTEGVYKIQSAEGEELGEVGFNKLIAKNAPMHSAAFINLAERSMEKFREDGPETGDYTIITLKRV
jgi:serine phosphatase RsbU (regulator of sigma subunit)